MQTHTTRRVLGGFAGLVASATLFTGCGLGQAGGFAAKGSLAGELAGVPRLDGLHVKVGSKSYTEQVLMGKIAIILLQSAGASVEDLTSIPGSQTARQAMLLGQTDFQFDYTGTAWISYLKHTKPIKGEHAQWEAVRDADAPHGLVWLPPAPANNTYSFAVTRQTQQAYGLRTMSDVAKIPVVKRSYCVGVEFASRDDGFEPWLKAYALPKPDAAQVHTMDLGVIYEATSKGTCTLGEIFTTDGRIQARDLVALDDDKKFFPNYNVAPVVTKALAQKAPQLPQLFAPVEAKMTNDVLRKLNARVDVDGEDPGAVARSWLEEEGFIAKS